MKRAWYKNKWVTVLIHITVWVLLFFLPYLLGSGANAENNRPQPLRAKSEIGFLLAHLNFFLLIGFFYLNALLLIPALFYKKKYGLYILSITLCFGLYAFAGWLISQNSGRTAHVPAYHRFMFASFSFIFILACSMAFKTIRDKIIADNIARLKENEFLKTELALLRSQVSPHFMFNVLNNMVSLARKKSDLLEPALIQLSSLMRYKLYDIDGSKISLEKECEYLQSYIGLQRQRFSNKMAINIDIELPEKDFEIESMLLIPFVENAFKHGTGLLENPQIDINLHTANNKLYFSVINKFNPASQEIKDKANGIGLANVQRRLDLLYPKDHILKLEEKGDEFIVSLQINLTS